MFVYSYNNYNGKLYKYKLDEIDLFPPMFNIEIHDNDLIPASYDKTSANYKFEKYKCMYCHTYFASRNKLFYHLGFMNININNKMDLKLIDKFNNLNFNYTNINRNLNRIKKLNKKRKYFLIKKNIKKSRRIIKKKMIKNLIDQFKNILKT